MQGFFLAEGETVYIMQSFYKFNVLLFCPIPTPYEGSALRIICENFVCGGILPQAPNLKGGHF